MMKLVIRFVFYLFLTGFLYTGSFAQNPFRPPAFPGGPYHPRRMILLERIERPVLLKISEQYMFRGTMGQYPDTRVINARIGRIRGDSLYLDEAGYRFRDIEAVNLPGYNQYRRSDSLKWRVIFPPEGIYADREAYSAYMKDVARQIKKQKAVSRSCFSFHNFLKLNLIKLANLEIAIDYEQRLEGRWSVEVETGYQFAAGNTMGDDFFLGTYPLWKYSGVNLIAGPKYYLGNIKYLQIVGIYRYLVMDLSRTKSGTGGSYGLQYQYRDDLGGAVRFGIMTKIGSSGVMDAYLGAGLKFCMIDQFIYGSYPYDDSRNYFHWYNEDHSPDNNHIAQLMPVINAGIKIGVGF